MLELQRIALRQQLQVIVASHSPVVLDSVPPEARVFLDRDDRSAEVRLMPAYRDIFQKSLYGQSRDQLSILCEDEVAEGVVLGVLDVLNARTDLRHEDFIIGRNTGQAEFPAHVRMLGRFGKLTDFLLVLDGDARDMETPIKRAADEYGRSVQPLFLPGNEPPEGWIWRTLRHRRNVYAPLLDLSPQDMDRRMRDIDQMMEGMVQQGDRSKAALEALAEALSQTAPGIARIIGRRETEESQPDLAEFLVLLEEQISARRQL